MVHLRLTGVSEDGRKLLLTSDARVEFTVDVDDRLRAAASGEWPEQGGEQAPTGQWERQMPSTLRPRDIQARIRAGESPESVAQVAGTSVDKVMPYAAPVLAERVHVAQRAQRASVRRRPAEGGAAPSARTLGDAVGSHLRSRNVDPETVTWDSWRREDARWTLTASFTTAGRVGAAHFSFDAPGNYVVADDDDAHWLLGEIPDDDADDGASDSAGSTDVPARDDLSDARRRRLSAVPPDELPLGDDAIELVSEDPAPEVASARSDETAALGAEAPIEAYLDQPAASEQATLDELVNDTGSVSGTDELSGETSGETSGEEAGDGSDDDQDPRRNEPPSRKPVKKTRGRASVPSWDEIMFGGESSTD